MQEREKLYADILKLGKKLDNTKLNFIFAGLRLIMASTLSLIMLISIRYRQANVYAYMIVLLLIFIVYYLSVTFFIFYKTTGRFVNSVLLGVCTSIFIVPLIGAIADIGILGEVLLYCLFGAGIIYDAYQVVSRPIYKKKLHNLQQQYAEKATARPSNFFRHNYKCKELGVMAKSEQLRLDMIKLKNKISTSKMYPFLAIVVRPLLAYFLYRLLVTSDVGYHYISLQERLEMAMIAFCFAYYISTCVALFFKDLGYHIVMVIFSIPFTYLISIPTILILFVFVIAYNDFFTYSVLIITSASLVFYDVYKILSRPVYKKKLTAMKEQYAQSMLQIEYE
jgi:hypothetical protein